MRRKLGIACMGMGAVLVLAALSLFLWNRQMDRQAGKTAAETMEQMDQYQPSGVPDPYDTAMTEVEIDGDFYIGSLSIPSLGLELPVMTDWSYPQLKIAPCRFTGSTKTDDLVVMAHNYTHHFGRLKELTAGETVFFTDMDRIVSRYEVAEVDILAPTAVEDMTAGEYDLTLFTCTYGGQSRVTVRCVRVTE